MHKLTEIKFNAIAITDIHNLSNIFYNAGVDGEGINVIFGENVTQIPRYLFYVNNSSYSPKITSIIIDKNLTSINYNSFTNCNTLTHIYFKGLQEEWSNVSGRNYLPATANVYFYTEGCIHEDGLWRFVDGKPSTELTIEWITDKEPTYEEAGQRHGTCSVCGEVTEEIPKLEHYIITNDATNPWTETEGLLTSGGKGVNNAVSTYTITTDAAINVTFEYKVSSEKYCDKLTIKKGTEVLVNGISGSTEYQALTVTLQAGEVLTFTYSKDGSGNTGDDCAYIKDLTITVVE